MNDELVHEIERHLAEGKAWSLRDAGQWLAEKWRTLEERYGRRQALAMATTAILTFPLPGNIAAIIAIAEAIRGLRGETKMEKSILSDLQDVYAAALKTDVSGVRGIMTRLQALPLAELKDVANQFLGGVYGSSSKSDLLKKIERRIMDRALTAQQVQMIGGTHKHAKGQYVSDSDGDNSIWIMTTGDTDRDGETVDPDGLDFSEFDLNPVVVDNHKTDGSVTDVVLGKVVRHWADDVGEGTKWPQVGGQKRRAQMAEIQWASSPAGQRARELAREGMLNGGSISFHPLSEPEKNAAGGNHYPKARLLEFTICPVGSNPSAVRVKANRRWVRGKRMWVLKSDGDTEGYNQVTMAAEPPPDEGWVEEDKDFLPGQEWKIEVEGPDGTGFFELDHTGLHLISGTDFRRRPDAGKIVYELKRRPAHGKVDDVEWWGELEHSFVLETSLRRHWTKGKHLWVLKSDGSVVDTDGYDQVTMADAPPPSNDGWVEEPKSDESEEPKLPLGYRMLEKWMKMIDDDARELHKSEQPHVIAAADQIRKIIDRAMKRYKDVLPDETASADTDVDADVSAGVKTKRLSKAARDTITDATEVLDDMATASDMPKRYKGSLSGVSASLKQLTQEKQDEEISDEDVEKLETAFKSLQSRLDQTAHTLYTASGIRV